MTATGEVTVYLDSYEWSIEGRRVSETGEWLKLRAGSRSFSINKAHILYIEGES